MRQSLIERLRDFPGNVLEGAPLCEAAAAELERLYDLAYSYPPHHCFAPDGVTWKQEAQEHERTLDEARLLLRELRRDWVADRSDVAIRIDTFLAGAKP